MTGKKHSILKSRGEEINLYIIFKILFDLKSINYINYLNRYIEAVNPKYIFHHSVNHRFFSIKKNFPELKTIFTPVSKRVYNGFRHAVHTRAASKRCPRRLIMN